MIGRHFSKFSVLITLLAFFYAAHSEDTESPEIKKVKEVALFLKQSVEDNHGNIVNEYLKVLIDVYNNRSSDVKQDLFVPCNKSLSDLLREYDNMDPSVKEELQVANPEIVSLNSLVSSLREDCKIVVEDDDARFEKIRGTVSYTLDLVIVLLDTVKNLTVKQPNCYHLSELQDVVFRVLHYSQPSLLTPSLSISVGTILLNPLPLNAPQYDNEKRIEKVQNVSNLAAQELIANVSKTFVEKVKQQYGNPDNIRDQFLRPVAKWLLNAKQYYMDGAYKEEIDVSIPPVNDFFNVCETVGNVCKNVAENPNASGAEVEKAVNFMLQEFTNLLKSKRTLKLKKLSTEALCDLHNIFVKLASNPESTYQQPMPLSNVDINVNVDVASLSATVSH